MADQVITAQKLIDADKDATSLDTFINGADSATVTTRKLRTYPSLAKAVKQVMETGGFEPFATEAALLASVPAVEKKAAKALDTKKVWLWDGVQWNDTGLSELDLAKQYTDIFNTITLNRDKTYPLQFFARNTTTNTFNAILNKALLSAKVDGATPNNLYRIGLLGNGYDYGADIGVSEGIRIQRTPLDRLNDGYALIIHDYTTKSVGLDYAKGGIQTITFACTRAPKTIITLTIDVDILNQTYGTPINLSSSSQVGYNTFIHTNTYSYRDNLIANDKLCGVEYDSVTQMLTFKYKTQNNQYYCVYMKRKAINNTFTIYGWGYADANPPSSDEVYDALSATYTMRTQADSDWISPLTVKAINNIDVGSENRAAFYTSGSHGSDGNAGGSATAEMIMLSIYVDDVKQSLVSSFKKRCDVVRVEVINAVQAYNTVDQKRPVLDQAQTYTLSKNGVYVTQSVKAREAIEITADNACQMYFAGLSTLSALSILMHGGPFTSRQIIQNSRWDTGALRNIYGAVTRLGAYEFASWVDPEFGIGDRRYVPAENPAYEFPRENGKLYPRLFSITLPTTFAANESYTWRGGYYWGATTAQDSIDSVLKVQSGTLILKNDGSYLINK